MSELKVYKILGIEFDSQFYHKSEADKVIAEKDAKIAELKDEIVKQEAENRWLKDENARLMSRPCYVCKEEQVKALENKFHELEGGTLILYNENNLRHNKYKRCLAMAKWCRESLRLMRTYEVTEDFWNLEPGQDAEYFCKKGDFYSKWRKRWLELAEEPTWAKFLKLIHKEAK